MSYTSEKRTYKVAVASGKGGTGKTTVAVNLFTYLAKTSGKKAQLIDCDVEEPNDTLFFENLQRQDELQVTQPVPVIDKVKCTWCRKCIDYCQFNAIVVIPTAEFAEVNSALCHSCGACIVACKEGAIFEVTDNTGNVTLYKTDSEDEVAEGRLRVGSAKQTSFIRKHKNLSSSNNDITIFDAPPGTSCLVVETISDADYVVLVTEPTPFGLYDLNLMVELLRKLKKTFGVVVNKAGIGNNAVYEYLADQNVELLGEVPFSREYAASYATGNLFNGIPPAITASYKKITSAIQQKILLNEVLGDDKN